MGGEAGGELVQRAFGGDVGQFGGHGQGLGAAAGVVGDHDVEVSEGVAGGVHEPGGGVGVGEVRADVLDASAVLAQLSEQRVRATGVSTPGLLGVVRGPGMQHHRGAIGDEPTGHTGADGDSPGRK